MDEAGGGPNRGRHVFVLLEGDARGFDLSALRREFVAGGGFVSVALVNGKRSNWVVRPMPNVDLEFAQVSPQSASRAESGILVDVADQIFEAQALVPVITSTEVRIYGGEFLEAELVRGLAGDPSIRIFVYDGSRLRAARSVQTLSGHAAAETPSPSAQETPTGFRPAPASGRQATHGSYGAYSLPQVSMTQGRSRTSSAATSAKASVPAASGSTRSKSAKPQATPPKTWAATSTGGMSSSQRPELRLFRRTLAGFLTAATVSFGVFPGFVWSRLWASSSPTDQMDIPLAVAHAQAEVFGIAVSLGLLVAVLGSRLRLLPLFSLGIGGGLGLAPGSIQDSLAWHAPPVICEVFRTMSEFFDDGLAWMPIVYIFACAWLVMVVSDLLAPSPGKG